MDTLFDFFAVAIVALVGVCILVETVYSMTRK